MHTARANIKAKMFDFASSITLMSAMHLIEKIRLMELPSAALVGYAVNIAVIIGCLKFTSGILNSMASRYNAWSRLLQFFSDSTDQVRNLMMLILSNCLLRISTWYSGSVLADTIQVILAMCVIQTISYIMPARTIVLKSKE